MVDKICNEVLTTKYRVCMLRHGESEWNELNLFCGWYNAPLSRNGLDEALAAGRTIQQYRLKFDVAHTSILERAQRTLQVMMEQCNQNDVSVQISWRLNERHYGALTGLNKTETVEKYGEEQVKIWRRSFDVPPPPMTPDHEYYKSIVNNKCYQEHGPAADEFPMFESLKMTSERTLPYWNDVIVPQILEGYRVLIVAHGNSLRAIIKHLDRISDSDIVNLNLPTGIPFIYELNEDFMPIVSMRFLADDDKVKAAMDKVEAQGKKRA